MFSTLEINSSRFDSVAHDRQQKLAVLVLLTNLAIVIASAGLYLVYSWDPGISSAEWLVMTGLFILSWSALLISAGAVGAVVSLLSVFSFDSQRRQRIDEKWLAKRRMLFFYAGTFANIAGIALLTEVTGGLGESPMVPLFVAFILIGPQLSRFKTQALVFLTVGLLLAVVMVACEHWASHPPELAPGQLTVSAVVLALLLGGVLTWVEKPYSYLLGKHIHPPSHARIYCDGSGNWRFYLTYQSHKQDPILLVGAVDDSDGGFPADLKHVFDAYAAAMAEAAGWQRPKADWPPTCADSFLVELSYVTPDDPP